MGRSTFSAAAYRSAHDTYVPRSGPATKNAEQKAHSTGKLHPLVDPAGYFSTRRSLLRFDELASGLFELTIGCSMPVETRLDTTGSMGGNVDIAIKALPDAYELCSSVLPGYDLHMLIGIFGDIQDRFPLCRPQFEMEAGKLVEQLTLMVPERQGGDFAEDPHYGLFGGAYLVAAYSNRIGLRGYDFTISDATARDTLIAEQLKRIYGPDVFDNVANNGHQIDPKDLPNTKEVVQDLLKRAHAFFLQVDDTPETSRFWTKVFGEDRVVVLPRTELLPQVQAVIIGLTEGTLDLSQVSEFLQTNNVTGEDAKRIARSVANIPLGAQVPLREEILKDHTIPKAGDCYADKTDLWPTSLSDADTMAVASSGGSTESDGPDWNL